MPNHIKSCHHYFKITSIHRITNDEQHNGVENKQVENSGNGRITSNRSDEMKFINRIERYSDIVEAAMKNTDGDILTEEELGPPLPPRPPPRIRNVPATDNGNYVINCYFCDISSD